MAQKVVLSGLAIRLLVLIRAEYRWVVGLVPIGAFLVLHQVVFTAVRNDVMLTLLQGYSALVIFFSALHLLSLIGFSKARRLHNSLLLLLASGAHGLVIWAASLHRVEPVWLLFLAPAVLLLCYHVIENEAVQRLP